MYKYVKLHIYIYIMCVCLITPKYVLAVDIIHKEVRIIGMKMRMANNIVENSGKS